jgi:hypothetical protein
MIKMKKLKPGYAPATVPDTDTNVQSFGLVPSEFDEQDEFIEHVVDTVHTHGSY